MKNIILIIALIICSQLITAQDFFGDLGVVWQLDDITTQESKLTNIQKQHDKGYIASGWAIDDGQKVGYIVQFNESGDKQSIKQWVVKPPNDPQWTEGNKTAWGTITHSFLTQDQEYIIAFGYIRNSGASLIHKGHSLDAEPLEKSEFLKDGTWSLKIRISDGMIVENKLERGNSYVIDAIQYDVDQFLIIGRDYQATSSGNFLFRILDSELTWLYDNYSGGPLSSLPNNEGVKDPLEWTNKIGVSPNGSLVISAAAEMVEFDKSNFSRIKVYANMLLWGEECVEEPDASVIGAPPGRTASYGSLKADGGVWAIGYMGQPVIDGFMERVGGIFYEKDANDVTLQCIQTEGKNVRQTINYGHPFLMSGETTKYIGTVSKSGVNYPYLCDDLNPGFNLTDATLPLPYNTSISTTSHTDGFFSCGQNPNTKRAAIVKMSTCVNFRVTTLPDDMVILKPYNPTINVSLPIEYEGAKGKVEYWLKAVVKSGTVDGKTEGEELSVESDVIGDQGSGLAFNLNKTYDLGTEYAIIEYTLVLKDSYDTAGTPQSCSQSYIFRVMTAPQTDVVSMPRLVEDGAKKMLKATLKNIGQGSFNNYKITIYDTAVGSATKYTYTHSGNIAMGETARFNIDLTGTDVANSTRMIVSFNDDGSGSGQAEVDTIQDLVYEVE